MLDDLKLRCLIEGKNKDFPISIPGNNNIDDLRNSIYNDAKSALEKFNARDLVLYKVEIDLRKRDKGTVARLAKNADDSKILEPGWATISTSWPSQPPPSMLSIFVKVSPSARILPPSYFQANFVSIDDGELRKPIGVEVPVSAKIHKFQNAIYSALQSHGLVGPNFEDNLDILPLQDIPSLHALQQKDLARLRDDALAPGNLPTREASEYFGPEESGGIHFLIWLPSLNERFTPSLHKSLHPSLQFRMAVRLPEALDFLSVTADSCHQEGTAAQFKFALKTAYKQSSDKVLFDMATGRLLRHGAVIASHIFQHRWEKYLPSLSKFTCINDVRNGLLLYKPVEWAFDRGKISIDIGEEGLRFLLLDLDLKGTLLTDVAKEIKYFKDEDINFQTTFGDLHGKKVEFPPGSLTRPSMRLLLLHAHASWIFSKKCNPTLNIPRPFYDILCDHSDDDLTKSAIRGIDEWERSLKNV